MMVRVHEMVRVHDGVRLEVGQRDGSLGVWAWTT